MAVEIVGYAIYAIWLTHNELINESIIYAEVQKDVGPTPPGGQAGGKKSDAKCTGTVMRWLKPTGGLFLNSLFN